jgi:hypothetical protein
LFSAGKWKRRVGVTAWLRQIGGNRVTGSAQIATEMAAPFELRTPTGTAANRLHQSANGSMATTALESTGRGRQSAKPTNRATAARGREQGGTARREARMRRCLKLRQGASPLRPPAPFPWRMDYTERRRFVKGSQSRQKHAALDKSSPLRRGHYEEGKGASRQGTAVDSPQGRYPSTSPCTARGARMRRCLILRQGANPLRPPPGYLT